MKKLMPLFLLCLSLLFSACDEVALVTPNAPQATNPPLPTATIPPSASPLPTEEASDQTWRIYDNLAFGFGFMYPSGWFGPDEYIVEDTLRLAVGSDVVYPYGTSWEEQVYQLSDSYYVVLQFTRNNQNPYWNDTYQALANLQDGESLSDARSLITRVRQIELGPLKGFEYISTLSETAQTELFYTREVLLVNAQTNDLLTISGSPNNVTVGERLDWREAYQSVDKAYLSMFHQIVDSIIVRDR